MDWGPFGPPGPPITYPHEYVNKDVSLADLAVGPDRDGPRRVVETRFVDCDIRGPGFVMFGDGTLFEGVAELRSDPKKSFWALAPGEAPPEGTILVDDCFFTLCRFREMIIVCHLPQIGQMERIFTPTDERGVPFEPRA